AAVTAAKKGVSCTEQARVTVECINQSGTSGPVCGNGIAETGEQCDGAAGVGTCPAGQSGTVTCDRNWTRNTTGWTRLCGNGTVDAGEECDKTAGVGICPAGTTGTVTCNQNCTRNPSACVGTTPPPCGNGTLDAGEQCDGSLGVGVCPAGTSGT